MMAVPQTPPPPPPEPANPPFAQYSASGRPNTRGERIAFQVWVVMFLLVVAVTLMSYLIGWVF